MVLNSAVKRFPPVGERFTIATEGRERSTCIEAEPCTCRGPEEPHEHYFIACPGLIKGATIEIAPDADAPSRYLLQIT